MAAAAKGHDDGDGPVLAIPRISIGASILATLFVVVITILFFRGDQNTRDTLNFFVLAGALAVGTLSAYYVWKGLRVSIEQRAILRRERQIQLSLHFVARWNDGGFASTRHTWRE